MGTPVEPMRWLLIVLLVSLVALLIASAAVALHVRRDHARNRRAQAAGRKANETEEAP